MGTAVVIEHAGLNVYSYILYIFFFYIPPIQRYVYEIRSDDNKITAAVHLRGRGSLSGFEMNFFVSFMHYNYCILCSVVYCDTVQFIVIKLPYVIMPNQRCPQWISVKDFVGRRRVYNEKTITAENDSIITIKTTISDKWLKAERHYDANFKIFIYINTNKQQQ